MNIYKTFYNLKEMLTSFYLDRQFKKAVKYLVNDSFKYNSINKKLIKHKKYVLKFISQDAYLYSYLPNHFKEDIDICLIASKKGVPLCVFSDKLKNNKEILHNTLLNDGTSLQYASNEMKDDENTVWIAIKSNSQAFKFASQRIRDSEAFIFYILQKNFTQLKYVSHSIKNNEKFLIELDNFFQTIDTNLQKQIENIDWIKECFSNLDKIRESHTISSIISVNKESKILKY
jgi:hypothetical protein